MALCKQCQKLKLDKTTRKKRIYSLGTKAQVFQKQTWCLFCKLVLSVDPYGIIADNTQLEIEWTSNGFTVSQSGPLLVPMNNGNFTPPDPKGFGCIIKGRIDRKMLKNWLSLCENGQGTTAKHANCTPLDPFRTTKAASSTGLKVLRLVDVNRNCVTEFKAASKTTLRYAALSYVQGGVTRPQVNKKDFPKLSKINGLNRKSPLPQTHQDTITVVKRLGLQYVWIDKLCLLSDDKSDTDNGMANMDRVYEGAVITIIAADGKTADAGIASIQKRVRVADQKVTTVMPNRKWGVVRGVYSHIHSNLYMSRGWT
jgi:hypothetical protein